MADKKHPFVDETARKTSTIVTKNSIAIPEDTKNSKDQREPGTGRKLSTYFSRRNSRLNVINTLRSFYVS